MTVNRAIEKAKVSITLQIYGLTDPDILTLLERKKREGLDIQIFYDKKASTRLPPSLKAHPACASGLMHRKILIVDRELVLIGTANFTTQSLKMHGNTMAGIFDPSLAQFLQESIETEKKLTLKGGHLTSYLLPDLDNRGLNKIHTCIEQATTSIHIAMFTLTHPKIVKELIHAKKRGVNVVMVIDRFTALGASSNAIKTLKEAGVEIRTSQGDQLLHYKWAFIDDQTLIMGSANWTGAAFEQNQDCLLVFEQLAPFHKKRLAKLWKAIAIASQTL